MTLDRSPWIVFVALVLLSRYHRCTESDFYSIKQSKINTDKKCERIKIPMCEGIDYNMTIMPNMFHHETQDEAGFEAHQFYPLVQIKCSEDLQFFLCSIYAPICLQDYRKPLPPCRSVCERVKKGCDPLLKKYTFKWPEQMDCGQFPTFNNPEKVLCMEKHVSSSGTISHKVGGAVTEADVPKVDNKKRAQQHLSTELSFQLSKQFKERVFCQCRCRKPFVEIFEINKGHFNRVTILGMPNCALGCKLAFFSSESDQRFVTFWLGLWTTICLMSTLSIITTFSINPSRYRYPERPIIFMSICYFMLSLGFALRLVLGHEDLACESISGYAGQSFSILKYGSSGPAQCTIVFLLIYYFGMAASMWWVLLTVTWFLAAGLKWGSEAISKYSQIYHFIAWFLPGLKSILALTMSAVDGDSISGICYIGNTSDFNLILFVLAPLIFYLVIGTLVLFSGFASLFRIRNIIKIQTGGKTEKLEKLMIRIGIFSVLYTAPAATIISCLIYELQYRSEWYQNLACDCYDSNRHQLNLPRPVYAIYMLKYFMYMAVGVSSGFWIWSRKTVLSWKIACNRLGITNCSVENRQKLTSSSNTEQRPDGLIRYNNDIHGRTATRVLYNHNYPSCNNITTSAATMTKEHCCMTQSQISYCTKASVACAPSGPLPSPPESSGHTTPPHGTFIGLCMAQQTVPYLQQILESPFISNHDTNPSCYFSSSGGRSIASSGAPFKPKLFSVAQL